MKKRLLFLALFTSLYTLPTFAQTWVGAGNLDKQFFITANIPAKIATKFGTANTDSADTSPVPLLPIENSGLKVAFTELKADKEDTRSPFISVTDAELQASLLEKIAVNMDAFRQMANTTVNDTLKELPAQQKPVNISALKEQIGLVTNDTLKASLYQQIANYYLKYDSIPSKKTKQTYQEAAIDYTIKALHAYSRYNDTPGLRMSFNNLVKVYVDQKKYSQAKWFVLQSNTMSRQQKDAANIIATLVELANIKMAIKDYSLAQRDLDEAKTLSMQNHFPKQESAVQQSYATLYTKLNKPKEAAAALKRHDFIEDSITKAADAQRLAALKSQDSTQQAKKKLYTSASRKVLKTSSDKKIVSL